MNHPRTSLALWMLVLLAGLGSAAHAGELSWSFRLEEGAVARIEILLEDDSFVARLLTSDGTNRSNGGWCPDLDPRPAWVRGELEHLYLAPGLYHVREILPQGVRTRDLEVLLPAEKTHVFKKLPPGTRGVIAWRNDGRTGESGLAFALPSPDGTCDLPVGPGQWCATSLGASVMNEEISASRARPGFIPRDFIGLRHRDTSQEWMVRFLLFPAALIILGFCIRGLWRSRSLPGYRTALLVSMVLGFLTIWPLYENPGELVLAQIDTPIHSMTLFTSIADSAPRLSDVSSRFSFPEGGTWLIGTSWIGYLVILPFMLFTDPILAHHLGAAFSIGLLAFAGWAMARRLGVDPWSALLASGCIALSPQMFRIIDHLRIDYLSLYLVPVFFLCLHKAVEERGWRWPLGAGISLAGVFYGQVYFGLYLLSACPLLFLPRLVGPDLTGRLVRLTVVGLVAGILLVPGLLTLQNSTRNTWYNTPESESLLERGGDLLSPLERGKVEDYVREHEGSFVPPMGTPRERLMAAVSRSNTVGEVLAPKDILPGNSFYWPLILLSILLARPRRRRIATIAALDVGILMLYSLGPFARSSSMVTNVPLPYYLNFLLIPSFESLKSVFHFNHLAVAISAIPLALGLDGLRHRLRGRGSLPGAVIWLPVVASSVLLLTTSLQWPEARRYERSPAIATLEPAPAIALPFTNPPETRISVDAMRHGLSLVNPLSFGQVERMHQPYWIETNGVLNQLAWRSGSDGQRCMLGLGDPSGDLRNLREEGLRYIIVYRSLLPEPHSVHRTEAFLNELFHKVADDGDVAVWEIKRP